jgi:hypothetical protein
MGKSLTNLEVAFISKSLDLSQENIKVLDVGAEAVVFQFSRLTVMLLL